MREAFLSEESADCSSCLISAEFKELGGGAGGRGGALGA